MNAALSAQSRQPPSLRRARRLLRSPKGYLLVALLALALFGAPSTGAAAASDTIAAAVLAAVAMESLLVRLHSGVWRLSASAVLSGLIVGMVLGAQTPWYVAAGAGALAADGKRLLRLGRGHVFNPAALGLLLVYLLFGSGQSWWGALAELPLPAIVVLIAAGAGVAQRANKLPAALAFLGSYLLLFTAAAYFGRAGEVADIFRPPFINMAVFFGCFMVTDPPTSPVAFPGQIWFGAGAALVSFFAYLATHGLYYLLIGVLFANAGYALARLAGGAGREAAERPSLPWLPAGREARALVLTCAAAGLALVVLVAAGLAAFHHSAHAGNDNGSRAGVGAAAAPAAAPAFDDTFSGTVAQHDDQNGVTIDLQLTGSGERPVQLAIHLTGASVGRGQVQVLGNQAVLSDGSGARLCQGQVTELSASRFAVACQGVGAYAGKALQVLGTITDATASRLEGDLQVAPAGD